MNKVLKLGFAMGGGVSLGTYSGAALSEAIKLLILHGGYHEDGEFKEYRDIEIDVFSGASAGSMALAVMMRDLIYQTDCFIIKFMLYVIYFANTVKRSFSNRKWKS